MALDLSNSSNLEQLALKGLMYLQLIPRQHRINDSIEKANCWLMVLMLWTEIAN